MGVTSFTYGTEDSHEKLLVHYAWMSREVSKWLVSGL